MNPGNYLSRATLNNKLISLTLSMSIFFLLSSPVMAAKIIRSSPPPQSTETPRPATTTNTPPRKAAPPVDDTYFYIGPQLGDSSVGLLLGYQLSRLYAIELSYDYIDPVRAPNSTLEKSRMGISGIALFPIKFNEMGPMSIYVKVGYGRATDTLTVTSLGIPPATTTTVTTTITTGVTGGGGLQLELSDNSLARLGVNIVGSDKTTYLSAMYTF